MATPLNGSGPNAPKITNASIYKRNGKSLPRDKKIAIPPSVRRDDGTLRMGNGG